MGRLFADMHANADDLLFMLGAFLVVYMLARFFKASPLIATCFGVLPPAIAYYLLNPSSPTSILALFS